MSLSDSIKLIRQKELLNQQEFADKLNVDLTFSSKDFSAYHIILSSLFIEKSQSI